MTFTELELVFPVTELELGVWVAELDCSEDATELEAGFEAVALDVASLELGLVVVLELGFTVAALEVGLSAAELEVGSRFVPELESGKTCGAVGVVLLSHAFQKNAVTASTIFFQCLYIIFSPSQKRRTLHAYKYISTMDHLQS